MVNILKQDTHNTTRAYLKMIKSSTRLPVWWCGIHAILDAAPDVKHDAEQLLTIGTVVNFWTQPKFQGAKVGEKFYDLAQLYNTLKLYTNGQLIGYRTNGMRCQTIHRQLANKSGTLFNSSFCSGSGWAFAKQQAQRGWVITYIYKPNSINPIKDTRGRKSRVLEVIIVETINITIV